jgi:exosome complex component RRP41
MAVVHGTNEIVLLQMDGHLTCEEFQKAMELSLGAAEKLFELQRDALRRRYSITLEEILKESPPAPPPPPEPREFEQMPEEPGMSPDMDKELRDEDFGPEGI